MKSYVIAIAIIEKSGRFLLRKSDNGFSFPYFSPAENSCVEDSLLSEMKMQTGLDMEVTSSGRPMEILSQDERYITLPFSLAILGDEKKTEGFQWLTKEEILRIDELKQEVFHLQRQRIL